MRWIAKTLRALRGPERSPRRPAANRRLCIEQLEDRLAPAASTFQSVIGLPEVQALYPYTGTGYSVAILDSGINYNDANLGGGYGPGHRVIAGYNFVANNNNPLDDNGHGTLIADEIGSSDPNNLGVAPNANFIDLKVLDSNLNGSWSNIEQGLQWVVAHQAQYNIVAVNLSLGSGNYTSDSFSVLETDLANLKSLGVFTAVASGNDYYADGSQPGLAYPAVDPDVVSVGATWAGSFAATTWASGAQDYAPATDQILSITQRSSGLDLLAPGAWINGDGPNGTTITMGGTSMATAVVTGSAVLLHQAYDQTGQSSLATESNILKLMQSTGVSIVDANNGTDNVKHTGLTFKRLNLLAAVEQIGQPITAPVFNPIANQTLPELQTIVIPLAVNDPSGSKITYTWTQTYLPALAYQLDQKYGFKYTGSYAQNTDGLNEKWIESSANAWYWILPDGELRLWGGSVAQTLAPANLIATLDPTFWTDPSKLWNAAYAGMPPAVFSLTGSNLSIRSPAPWLGTYSVAVSASDPHYTVMQTFNVTEVQNYTPPVLAAIANQTLSHSQHVLTVGLNASDSNGAAITYSAQVVPSNGVTPAVTLALQGNQLTISPALSVVGPFTVQVSASDGKTTVTQSFTVTVIDSAPVLAAIANVTASHGKPIIVNLSATDADKDALTYSAQALPSNGQPAPLSVSIQGSQLTVRATQPVIGTYTVQVTVSDGALTATRTFTITLTNAAPTLSAIAVQSMTAGQTKLTIPLAASDADGDALTFQAAAETPSALAYQLDQKYGFTEAYGSYYVNLWGMNEKWLMGSNSVWYFILPNGNLYRWAQSVAASLQPSNLIASVGPAFYTDPRLLWNAAAPVSPALTFSFTGSQLTIQRPTNLSGVFYIDVTVSDGLTTSKQTAEIVLN